ncbi:MAG: tetratricopeptide repeat protein [Candidatus Pacebacteria bacterium]|nr:tetratricopeptide repeat protein [Candidatus Paceibacterota bacterium]
MPLFWLPFSFEAFEFNKQYLLFFLVSLAFLAWIAKMVLVDKELRFKKSPLDLFILVFLFVAVLSAVFSVDKISSIFGFYGRFSDGLIGLLSLGMLYFLITNNVGVLKEDKQKEKLPSGSEEIPYKKILKIFTWSVFFVVLMAYFSIFGIWSRISGLLGGKIALPSVMLQSVFNPAAGSLEGLAVFLAVVSVFLIGKIITTESKTKKGGGFGTYFLLFLILILLVIIDFTAAWLVILASLALFLVIVLWKRTFKQDVNKLLLPILFVVLSAAFLFINSSPLQDLVLRYQLPREQVITQPESWSIGFKGAVENVKSGFLGSGTGTFHYDFSKFRAPEFNQSILWQIRFDRGGSHISEILGTMGFLGILSYLALIGVFFLISYLFLQQNRSGIPLMMVFLALLVGQFVYYQNTILAFTFWLILGLSVVNWQKPVQEKTITFKDFPELSLVFSAVLIVFALVFLGMYFFAGKFYLADIDYRTAMGEGRTENLEKAVNLNPYQTQYKIVLARDYLSKITAENQKPADQRDQTALSLDTHYAITYAKGGQLGNKVIKGAADLSPNRVAVWETLGMIYRDIQGIATGALDWGIKSFEKAITLEPANPVLHTELGKLYLTSGDSNKARDEWNKAKELKADYTDSSVQLALLSESEGNSEEAIRMMENLVMSYPYDVEAIFQLGRLYFNSNRTSDAVLQFERVVNLMPNHSNAHYSLAVAYQKQGKTSKAIEEYEKVLELNPGNEDVQAKLDQLRK